MRRLTPPVLILSAIFLGVLATVIVYVFFGKQFSVRREIASLPGRTVVSTPKPVGEPVRLLIPKLNISANIEKVGMDSQGRMDVPSNDLNVAWFEFGVRPGERGSAVIDGHFDTVTGKPAVFYYLNNLEKGDEIEVVDFFNNVYKFKVTDKVWYPFDSLPLKYIFASNDGNRLNLITCEGVWDPVTRNYSQRIVVYSQME